MSNNYRRIPVEVEAFKWNGESVKSEERPDVPSDIPENFLRYKFVMCCYMLDNYGYHWLPYVSSTQKWVLPGSWLVIEHNRLYVIPQDELFHKLYTPIERDE